jgi:hypothetical protein
MPNTFLDEGTLITYFDATTAAALVDLDALTITELATGKDVSDLAIVGSTNFNFVDSDTIDEPVYSDVGATKVPTRKHYEANATFRRTRVVATGVLDTTDLLASFNDRQTGVFVVRPGLPEATAWAAGQDYQWFKVQADKCNPLSSPDGGYEKLEVNFLENGGAGYGVSAAGA